MLLHGLNQELVKDIKDFLESLGLSASTVLQLYSNKMPQNDRVEYQIKNCGIPLILATFDEKEKKSTKARPNIYSEITRCLMSRPNDTIVLREVRDGKRVDLATNEEGKLIILEFEMIKLHRVYPQLITELKGREILLAPKSSLEKTLDAGDTLHKFLDEMDNIWEQQFDIAGDCIDMNDYETENKFQLTLDKFFLEYHRVLNAMIRLKQKGDELREVCDTALRNSKDLASKVWETVYEGKKRLIEQSSHTKYQTNKKALAIIEKNLPEAVKPVKQLRLKVKGHLTHEGIIKAYRQATDNLTNIQRQINKL